MSEETERTAQQLEGGGGGAMGVAAEEVGPSDCLFSEEQRKEGAADGGQQAWWKANFFLKEPVLFGTWDGVFTSVMVNIFGVIVFLRMGWIVGNAGVADAVLLLLICAGLALLPVLSAIGICERCQIQSGGVYFLVSHILGGQLGSAVGILYTFGQAVATALVAVGFGDSMAHLLTGGREDVIAKSSAVLVLILLVAINIAGVKWVVKLQLALLSLLVLAVVDLAVGSLFRRDVGLGVVGLSSLNFRNNTDAAYVAPYNFFSVFGVFFSNFIGVLAGVNMSGDLKDPSRNIPLGELSAVAVRYVCTYYIGYVPFSSGFCFLFIMILGSVCSRYALQFDPMIAEKVSATRLLFLAGLYISSLSSILGSLYGAPRVAQSIAAENTIPILKPLEEGRRCVHVQRGPNKIPVAATMVLTAISLVFVFFELNSLAMMATIPFLITYAFVNYSYVSLAFAYDLQQQREAKAAAKRGYGSMGKIKGEEDDLDELFPERRQKPIRDVPMGKAEQDSLAKGDDGDELARPSIIHQPASWYSVFCNRWVSLLGAVVNLVMIFLIHKWFALIHLVALAALYIYIGRASPGVFQGISDFSLAHSFRITIAGLKNRDAKELGDDQVIVAPLHPSVDTFRERLNEDNVDYAARKQYHQTKTEELGHNFD